jgi:hypothetical protein
LRLITGFAPLRAILAAAFLISGGGTACRLSTGPRSFTEDTFGPGALSNYTAYSDEGNPWSLGTNTLQGNGFGLHSVLIRNSIFLPNGWVEAVVDSADDGGLVSRFSDNETYYLLAIRDDAAPPPRNIDNLQIYRRTGAGQAGFESLWRGDMNWPRGVAHSIRFETLGDQLTVYLDSHLVVTISDTQHLPGGGIGVRHYGNSMGWITRYHRLSWGSL